MIVPEYAPEAFKTVGLQAVRVMSNVLSILRGNVTLKDHIKLFTVDHTFTAVGADTEEDVDISDLSLDYTPTYFLVLETDDGAVVYPSDKSNWSSTTVKAKSSKVGTTVTMAVW